MSPDALDHSHHRGDRVEGQGQDAQFVLEVRYDKEAGVSYSLGEDRFGEAMDAVRQFVKKAIRDGGEMTIRIAPRQGETDSTASHARRATDAILEEPGGHGSSE